MNYKKILYGILCLALGSLFVVGGKSFAQVVVQCGTEPNPIDVNYSTTSVVRNQCSACVLSCNGAVWSAGVCNTGSCTVIIPGGGQCPGSPGCPGYQETIDSIGSGCTSSSSTLYQDPYAENDFNTLSCSCIKGYGELNGNCEPCNAPGVCCGVKLNTNVPFIGDCIETKAQDVDHGLDEGSAFPILMGSLVKILISVILIASFVMIIIGGVRIATGDAKGGKDMIKGVIIALAVLGALGVILRLINPNFFG